MSASGRKRQSTRDRASRISAGSCPRKATTRKKRLMGIPSQTRGERKRDWRAVGSACVGSDCTSQTAPSLVLTARDATRRAGGGVYDGRRVIGDEVSGGRVIGSPVSRLPSSVHDALVSVTSRAAPARVTES